MQDRSEGKEEVQFGDMLSLTCLLDIQVSMSSKAFGYLSLELWRKIQKQPLTLTISVYKGAKMIQ